MEPREKSRIESRGPVPGVVLRASECWLGSEKFPGDVATVLDLAVMSGVFIFPKNQAVYWS
jgi:hypothetical protein